MSAFVLSDNHINSMVEFVRLVDRYSTFGVYHKNQWQKWDLQNPDSAAELGLLLKKENVRSVNCRYSEDTVVEYKYQRPAKKLTPVEMFKAIDCYEYQACETDDWEESITHKVCDAMRKKATYVLDGYEDAPWGID